jgi:NADH:ubiquinone oxidoreductase subunit 6 (subunit J)
MTPCRHHDAHIDEPIMLLKIIAFLSAAIPLFLFVRSMFVRRPTRVSEGWKAFKKQIDLAVWIFLGLVGCLVAFAAGKLAWTWWTSL